MVSTEDFGSSNSGSNPDAAAKEKYDGCNIAIGYDD